MKEGKSEKFVTNKVFARIKLRQLIIILFEVLYLDTLICLIFTLVVGDIFTTYAAVVANKHCAYQVQHIKFGCLDTK